MDKEINVFFRKFTETFECPTCHCRTNIRFTIEERRNIENVVGIEKVIESPLEIRVLLKTGDVVILNKEVPTMVLEM